jgi:hypothetical protein
MVKPKKRLSKKVEKPLKKELKHNLKKSLDVNAAFEVFKKNYERFNKDFDKRMGALKNGKRSSKKNIKP